METITELQCKACYAPLEAKKQHSNIVKCEFCGTENVLSREIRTVVVEHSQKFMVRLYGAIYHDFGSMDEMRHLITLLNGEIEPYLNFENIAGDTAQRKALELVQWCYRRYLLQDLVNVCLSLRPNMDI